jgi:hypothetical protein
MKRKLRTHKYPPKTEAGFVMDLNNSEIPNLVKVYKMVSGLWEESHHMCEFETQLRVIRMFRYKEENHEEGDIGEVIIIHIIKKSILRHLPILKRLVIEEVIVWKPKLKCCEDFPLCDCAGIPICTCGDLECDGKDTDFLDTNDYGFPFNATELHELTCSCGDPDCECGDPEHELLINPVLVHIVEDKERVYQLLMGFEDENGDVYVYDVISMELFLKYELDDFENHVTGKLWRFVSGNPAIAKQFLHETGIDLKIVPEGIDTTIRIGNVEVEK